MAEILKELNEYRRYHLHNEQQKALSTLEGFLIGIAADKEFRPSERDELLNWCATTGAEYFADIEPFQSVLTLIYSALDDNILTADEYMDIEWAVRNAMNETGSRFDLTTVTIQTLHGIMHGILADGAISDAEVLYMKDWLQQTDFLKGTYPYDELESMLCSILADKVITEDERNVLKVFFSEFIDTTKSFNISSKELDQLKNEYVITGICALCPEITFKNKTFCFTGASSRSKRSEIADKIIALRGTYIDRISSKIDYLIVGNNGNPCFAYSCYGRKIEEAVALRKRGERITIVHENDFWDAVADLK